MEAASSSDRRPHWRASERWDAADAGAWLGVRVGGGFCWAREAARLFTRSC